MNYQTITKMQKDYGYDEMQNMINTGQCWLMEGSVGRQAMNTLESGACMLPKKFNRDYYGSTVPSRDVLEAGSKGTFKNSQKFWQSVEDNGELL